MSITHSSSGTNPSYVKFNSPTPNVFTFDPDFSIASTTIKVEVSLSDGANKVPYSFDLNVINNAPTFNSPLINQVVKVGTTKSYSLPSATDPEGYSSLQFLYSSVGNPAYVKYNGLNTFTFDPDHSIASTSVTINVEVSDGVNKSPYAFSLDVINNPPSFTSGLVKKTVKVGATLSYTLPSSSDPEGYSPLLVSHVSVDPAYIKLTGTKFDFTPSFTES